MKDFFILFANCIVVKGITRSSICDLQKGNIYFISNSLAALIDNKSLDIESIKKDDEVKKWIETLIDQELGFITKTPEYYPKLSMEWNSPEIIKDSIIEMDHFSIETVSDIIKQLHELHCKFIEFRFYKKTDISILLELLPLLRKGTLKGIIVYVPYPKNNNLDQIYSLFIETGLTREVVIHSCTKENILQQKQIKGIHFTEQKIDTETHCGQISSNYFSINTKTFSESKTYNTCLNKKISIDKYGNIKHCPSMKESYGNIKDTAIKQVVKNNTFTKIWNITKDQVESCKNCEFRYVCTDCRAYIENPHNMYSKPLKCGYDPETNEWEEWSKNPLKKDSMKFYNLVSD